MQGIELFATVDPLLSSQIVRVALAIFLGGFIGMERSISGKAAGMRTFALVSLGACLFMLISEYYAVRALDPFSFDPTRIAAGIVTGIGFLGAGLIIFNKELRGLTTAAGLWVTAGVGAALGAGMYLLPIITALAIVAIYRLLWYLEEYVESKISSVERAHELSLEKLEENEVKNM